MYIFIHKIKSAYRKTVNGCVLNILFLFLVLSSINIKLKEVVKKNFKKGVNLFFLIPIRVNLWHFTQIFLPKIINILKYLRSTTFGCKDKGIRR